MIGEQMKEKKMGEEVGAKGTTPTVTTSDLEEAVSTIARSLRLGDYPEIKNIVDLRVSKALVVIDYVDIRSARRRTLGLGSSSVDPLSSRGRWMARPSPDDLEDGKYVTMVDNINAKLLGAGETLERAILLVLQELNRVGENAVDNEATNGKNRGSGVEWRKALVFAALRPKKGLKILSSAKKPLPINRLGLDMALCLLGAACKKPGLRGTLAPVPPRFQRAATRRDVYSNKAVHEVDVERLTKALEDIPPLKSSSFATLEDLSCLSEDSLDLLLWVITSSFPLRGRLDRKHLRFQAGDSGSQRRKKEYALEPEIRLMVKTPKDPFFCEMENRHGTIEVYHGSATYNWHSISRKGLRVMSYTEGMDTGAIFGVGIYFSDKIPVARQFAQGSFTWNHSIFGHGLEVVGVFDLVNSPDFVNTETDPDSKVPDSYYVVKDSRGARLRELLIWKWQRPSPRSCCWVKLCIAYANTSAKQAGANYAVV